MTQLIKDFLEAEKNMFDYCKSFMSFSFLLNTGCLGILLKLYPNLYVIIYTIHRNSSFHYFIHGFI